MENNEFKLKDIIKIPPFNAERQLKRRISTSFWADANDFLWRVSILKDNRPHDTNSYFAKLYVDLLMSAECSLKSLIISLSKKDETPEEVYLEARKKSHHLDKLYNEVVLRAKRRIKLLSKKEKQILFKANTLGVGYRYDIKTFFFLSQEDFIKRMLEEGDVSSIINFDFINELFTMLHELKKIAKISLDKYYGKDNSLSGNNMEKLENRQNLFFTNVGNKL